MKTKFSAKWNSSKQPRKQKKFTANAPLHLKRKLLGVNLSKELRKKQEQRNVVVRKGDKVKIMRGKYKGKSGKILKVYTLRGKIEVEGIQIKKLDGSKVNVKLVPSNLQIIELYLEDKKRFGKNKIEIKTKQVETTKKEDSKNKIGEKKK